MDYGCRRGKKKLETWKVVREIYWCERNNKNKWHVYLLTCGIKLVCTLSFIFEGNCGTNWKALLECMNRQYFFPFDIKIKKKKVKFQNLIFFCSWCMVRWFSLVLLWKIEKNNNYWITQLWLCPQQHPIDSRPRVEKQFGGEYHLEDLSNNHQTDQKELDPGL